MKKIISSDQIRAADQHTILNEPIASIELMERASTAFVDELTKLISPDLSIHIVCGVGNNGGDGLAASRILTDRGFKVKTSLIKYAENLSPDCRVNFDRCKDVNVITEVDGFEISEDLIIDALFGSGLNRPVKGFGRAIIERINSSKAQVVSLDMPSGLFADVIDLSGAIVLTDRTITFQRPKLSFLIPESGAFVSDFAVVDIGIDEEFIESQASDYNWIEEVDVEAWLPRRKKFQHKGDFGRVQVFSGSFGKIGAAFLCAKAVLKSGAGLLTVHVPKCGYEILQSGLPEAIVSVDTEDEFISSGKLDSKTDAICIGPGLGTDETTLNWFAEFLNSIKQPVVLDADALNMLAMKPELLDIVPRGSVLTPHVGEFNRLFGSFENGLERIEEMKSVALENGWVIVLKGANSAIALPDGKVVFNSTGNVGMATGGSGDVLSGVITGLIAQGVDPSKAAMMGVYLHGKAGDIAENKVGKMSLMASDLLNELPKAINNVVQERFI